MGSAVRVLSVSVKNTKPAPPIKAYDLEQSVTKSASALECASKRFTPLLAHFRIRAQAVDRVTKNSAKRPQLRQGLHASDTLCFHGKLRSICEGELES